MLDEHFMRDWNATHERFSRDVGRGFVRLGERLGRRTPCRNSIGHPYGTPSSPRPKSGAVPPAARAALRGLAAVVMTFGLWLTVMAIATPAPGLAAQLHATVAASGGCDLHPALA